MKNNCLLFVLLGLASGAFSQTKNSFILSLSKGENRPCSAENSEMRIYKHADVRYYPQTKKVCYCGYGPIVENVTYNETNPNPKTDCEASDPIGLNHKELREVLSDGKLFQFEIRETKANTAWIRIFDGNDKSIYTSYELDVKTDLPKNKFYKVISAYTANQTLELKIQPEN